LYDTDMVAVKAKSSLRTEQAAQTRRRILDAAIAVFEAQGFAGTRIEDIALQAGVAVPTVYKGFVNKPGLLVAALNQAMAGGEGVTALDQLSWFTEQLDEPDPVRQLGLIARNARRLYERAGLLLNVLHAAALLDADLAAASGDIEVQRLARSRRTAKNLIAKAGARSRLPREELAITLCALTEPALFTAYTFNARNADQYERWLRDILCRSVLD
jgi:AcrR family transcriptional regulator